MLSLKSGDSLSQISAVLSEIRWRGREYADGVICIDDGLTDNEKIIIERMALSDNFLRISKIDELENML